MYMAPQISRNVSSSNICVCNTKTVEKLTFNVTNSILNYTYAQAVVLRPPIYPITLLEEAIVAQISYILLQRSKNELVLLFLLQNALKILKNIQHAMQKNLLFSQLCAYMVTSEQYLAEILGSLYLLVGFSIILLSNIHFLCVAAQYAFKILLQFLTLSL